MKVTSRWFAPFAALAVAACTDTPVVSGPDLEAPRYATSGSSGGPDLTGNTWDGWTYVGTNCDFGIYAKGSHCTSASPEGYKIYTVVYESTGPTSLPGSLFNKPATEFAAGNRILAIGFEKTAGGWTYPFLKLDFDNNSYTASTTPPASGSTTGDGQTSGGGWATIGDATVQFQEAGAGENAGPNGQPSQISIYTENGLFSGGTGSAAFQSHPCGSYGCANGLPAIRGVINKIGGHVFKTYFDLTTLPGAYPNSVTGGSQAVGTILNQLSVSIAMISPGNANAEAFIKVSTQLPSLDQEAPVVTNVVASPAALGTSATLTATATDNSAVTAASYTINGGTAVPFTVATPGSPVSLSASIPAGLAVGVYEVCVTAEDAAGNTSAVECAQLAVYDPSAGFVTGGGWFNSPAGAFRATPGLTGRANFGFVSKYERGASIPSGDTNFQFQAGRLSFASTSYEWLVVNRNDTNAQYKGVGTVTINGVATTGAGFMLWAQDGRPDLFRILISAPNGDVIYDNKIGDEFGTAIGGGNIIVHTK